MNGIALVALAALVFALSFVLTAGWRRYALNRHLLDSPNARSAHVAPSPSGGGIGIVVASTVAGAWLVFFHAPGSFTDGGGARILVAVGLAVPLAGVGLLDDARGVSAKTRFVVQAVLVGFDLAPGIRIP